MLRQKRR